jgi:hypothetical protein
MREFLQTAPSGGQPLGYESLEHRSKVLSDRNQPIYWGLGVIPRQPSRSVSAVSAPLVSKP